jgi:pectinesterase
MKGAMHVSLLLLISTFASQAPAETSVVPDIVYARYPDRQLRLDLYLPAKKPARMPGIVVIRGGGWRQGDKRGFARIARALAEQGFAAACIEYRVLPESRFPAAVHDSKAAVRWMRAEAAKHGIDPNAIGAIGGSAGGHLVSLLGTSHKVREIEGDGGHPGISSRVQAVVAMAPVVDFTAMGRFRTAGTGRSDFLGVSYEEKPDLWKLASPISHLDRDSASFLLMHSKADRTVPHEQSMAMLGRCKETGVKAELWSLDDAPHAFWNGEKYFAETIQRAAAFFRAALGR